MVMEGINLKEQQEYLDSQKYYRSLGECRDCGGLMSYCDECAFKKFDTERDRFICNLDYEIIKENNVCANNYIRRNKSESDTIQGKTGNTKGRRARQKDNGKS